jgi:hypothetical protein
MSSRVIKRAFSSDFAHKQVSSGFSKKYGEQFERIFGKRGNQVKNENDQARVSKQIPKETASK